jgi:hypothetical protein
MEAPVESWITYEENKIQGILLKEEDISSSLLLLTIPSRSTLFHVSNSDCSDSIEYMKLHIYSPSLYSMNDQKIYICDKFVWKQEPMTSHYDHHRLRQQKWYTSAKLLPSIFNASLSQKT